jgi:hypothetical protein
MARAVGIDLGTTNSLVGYTWRGKETMVPDPVTSREWIPSLVGLDQGGQMVFGNAVEALVDAGHANAVHSVKRLMGRRWDDAHVQRLIRDKLLFYTIIEHPEQKGEIGIPLGDRIYTPTEISSLILRQLAEAASAMAGDSVSHAVITVPAYFRDPAIRATREAGRLAGLRVKHVMEEPTAAAMAYGADELDDGSGRYIVVFDFGGGTFDVSIILAAGGTLNVLRVGGDNFLGGDDIDRAVMQRWDDQLRATEGVSIIDGVGLNAEDADNHNALKWKFKLAARQGKEALAAMETTTVVRPALFRTASGSLVNVSWTMSRGDLVAVSRPFVDRAMESVRLTLEEASLSATEINQVVVAGGSSRLPEVVDRLRTMFPDAEILNSINPMTAIATGAIRTSRSPFPWTCPECERENEMTADTCLGCGAAPASEQHACDSCGALMDVKEDECPNPQCRTRVERHAVPSGVLSHDYEVRVVDDGERDDSGWRVLIGRDAPIQADQVQGSEAGPWVNLYASHASMDHVHLPIAQDVDEDDEDPEVIGTFEVVGLPKDLHENELIEVRLFLHGDRVAEPQVRIRGEIHSTRLLAADEISAVDTLGTKVDEVEEWREIASRRVTWLRLTVHGAGLIPETARTPANYGLIQAAKEPASIADRYADKIESAVAAGDQRRAEALIEESEGALEEALPIAETLGLATIMISVTDDLDARRELSRAVDDFAVAVREGDEEAPFRAWSALQVAMGQVDTSRGGDSDVPLDQQHLLRARRDIR